MEPVQAPRVFSNRYELTHLIARGGMAQVYRARDRLLDRPVALKVLFPELSVDRAFVERFRREAQAAANLSHPNIVPVFDWGEDGGTYFIVMEFVDGRPLSALLRASGPLDPERAADIGCHVAAALAYAHRHGVVHRDVKPGNVLITDDGQVKVTDFGIARAVNTEESLTQTGAVMGTAAYFSPEQAEGVGVDSRSDIYSLGVVIFEMITGRPPFLGETPVAVASKHVRDQPPLPRQLNPAVPPALEAVVMKAMAKAPQDRYASAEDLRGDLTRFIEGQPVTAGDPGVTGVQSAVDTLAPATAGLGATRAVGSVDPTRAAVAGVPVVDGSDTVEEASRRRARRLRIVLVVLVVALVVVALLLLRSLGYLGKTDAANVNVPNVVGKTVAAATSALKADELNVGRIEHTESPTPRGTVTGTAPVAGTSVKKGQSVTLEVSSGAVAPTRVLVPNVVGQQLTEAAQILEAANLTYSVTTKQSSMPSGQVLSQDPVSGLTVPKGDKVVLTVSTQTSTTVPNVVGQSQPAAGSALTRANLSVGDVTSQCSSANVPSGDVISSDPAAGTSLSPQNTVALVVSTGPCTVVLQNVVGQTQSMATGTLQMQSGQLQIVPNPVTPSNDVACTSATNGQVVGQSPGAGTQVSASSTVSIDVCSAPTTPPPSSTTTTTTSSTTTTSTTTTTVPPAPSAL